MRVFKVLCLWFLPGLFFSCGDNAAKKIPEFTLNFINEDKEFQLGDTLKLSVEAVADAKIDSTKFSLYGMPLGKTLGNNIFTYVVDDVKLGRWKLSAEIFSQGKSETIEESATIYNDVPPQVYTYTVIETYPHSPDAYTQGLEFYNDTLYESTGQYGSSSLRKVDLKTGKVLHSVALDQSYFAEGMTIFQDRIYQLTWKEGEGFIYDINTFERTGSFAYNQSKEGWGLTNDGERFYKSDGTERIWILHPETMAEQGYIQTVTNRSISTQLNELEWVDGKIYANTYQKDGVAIINPENGAIEGVIDFSGLRDKLGNVDVLDPLNDVLNGIAYNPNDGKLYVTGKDWDKLFEVEIVKK